MVCWIIREISLRWSFGGSRCSVNISWASLRSCLHLGLLVEIADAKWAAYVWVRKTGRGRKGKNRSKIGFLCAEKRNLSFETWEERLKPKAIAELVTATEAWIEEYLILLVPRKAEHGTIYFRVTMTPNSIPPQNKRGLNQISETLMVEDLSTNFTFPHFHLPYCESLVNRLQIDTRALLLSPLLRCLCNRAWADMHMPLWALVPGYPYLSSSVPVPRLSS